MPPEEGGRAAGTAGTASAHHGDRHHEPGIPCASAPHTQTTRTAPRSRRSHHVPQGFSRTSTVVRAAIPQAAQCRCNACSRAGVVAQDPARRPLATRTRRTRPDRPMRWSTGLWSLRWGRDGRRRCRGGWILRLGIAGVPYIVQGLLSLRRCSASPSTCARAPAIGRTSGMTVPGPACRDQVTVQSRSRRAIRAMPSAPEAASCTRATAALGG